MKVLVLLLVTLVPTQARHWYQSAHFWSTVAVIGASVFDAQTSVGRVELNPILADRGRFTSRSYGIKLGLTGGWIIGQELYRVRHPESRKSFTVTNFILAGTWTSVGVRNQRQNP